MNMYRVAFKHSKVTNSGYRHQYTDWTLIEAGNENEAIYYGRMWVRENRFMPGCKNYVRILEVKEVR